MNSEQDAPIKCRVVFSTMVSDTVARWLPCVCISELRRESCTYTKQLPEDVRNLIRSSGITFPFLHSYLVDRYNMC